MSKEKLLEYLDIPVETTAKQNIMGCSESWYDPYYAIKKTFTREQIQSMTDAEVANLILLAENIAEGLY